jgi:hypothetical protein
VRACRGVGAALEAAEVAAFDAEHAELLARIAPDPFHVLHRIDAHLIDPLPTGTRSRIVEAMPRATGKDPGTGAT